MAGEMHADLVSVAVFGWIVTALAVGLAAPWIVVDIVRLRRALREDVKLPVVRDRIFGSIVGMAIGAIGLIGAVLYQLHR
jgi:hypothetical protein